MIEQTVAKWHDVVAGKGDLDALLADDVVFLSPIVFTPQQGKDVTKLYLGAAANTSWVRVTQLLQEFAQLP